MAYCTSADVFAIVETDVTAAEVDDLIDECDDLLDLMLDMGSLSANIRRALSRTYTAIRVFLKDPNAERLGEQQYDRDYQLKKLNEEFDRMVRVSGGGMSFTYGYAEMPEV